MKFFYPGWTFFETQILLCGLITLSPTNRLFKELNLLPCNRLNKKNHTVILLERHNFPTLFLLLNKPAIRKIAFSILKPLLEEFKGTRIDKVDSYKDFNQVQLVQNYLKKYKYFYKLFFSKKSYIINKQPLTDKEINLFAIKSLFLIIGI